MVLAWLRGIIAAPMRNSKPALKIKSLRVAVEGKEVVKGVDLIVKPGELHAIMGPNGSGKSSMASALMGHPKYEIFGKSRVLVDGQSLLELAPDERLKAGLFLAFQYPVEVPGVKVQNFLRHAHHARFAEEPDKQFQSVLDFRKHLEKLAEELWVDKNLLTRGLNEGFSGGEKKRLEILQMAVLEPKYAILDETDSGLDIDAIRDVAKGVKKIAEQFQMGILVITHYQRILEYLKPDFIHVMKDGRITKSGGRELAESIEVKGYRDEN